MADEYDIAIRLLRSAGLLGEIVYSGEARPSDEGRSDQGEPKAA